MIMRILLPAVLAAGGMLLCGNPALAYQYSIVNFKVVRNGATYFEDRFSDGSAPPSAPNFSDGTSASYGGNGSFGPESNNRLTINSTGLANGGDPSRLVQRAVLRTDTSSDLTKGLKSSQTFSVSGTFDLIVPQTITEWYGVELRDSTSQIEGTERIRVRVGRISASSVVVRFIRKNPVTLQTTLIDERDLDPGHSQIQLTLTKANAASNVISASFAYVDNGVVGTPVAFANTTTAFSLNPFLRAAFFASTPVANAVTQGANNNLTLTANLMVAQEARNLPANIYVAALTGGLVFFNNGITWAQYTGGAFPIYSRSTALTEQTITLFRNLDVSPYADLTLYIGYGATDADLISNQSFSRIFCGANAQCIADLD